MEQTAEHPNDNSIYIGLDNASPISAEELARLLSSFAMDYRRGTGGTLVVTRVETGSLDIWLQDALLVAGATTAIAGSVVAVAEAVKRINGFWAWVSGYLRGASRDVVVEYRPQAVAISCEMLVDLAARHGASLTIRQYIDGPKGEIEVTLAASQALQIRERSKADGGEGKKLGDLATQMRNVLLSVDDSDRSDLKRVIPEYVALAKSAGHIDIGWRLAADLEAVGKTALARAVREDLNASLPDVTNEVPRRFPSSGGLPPARS